MPGAMPTTALDVLAAAAAEEVGGGAECCIRVREVGWPSV